MTQIGLQRSRIQALICQRVAAGMPKHVRVYLKTDLGFLAGARQQLGKSRGGERTAPFGGKHEGRSRLALETFLAPVIHRRGGDVLLPDRPWRGAHKWCRPRTRSMAIAGRRALTLEGRDGSRSGSWTHRAGRGGCPWPP